MIFSPRINTRRIRANIPRSWKPLFCLLSNKTSPPYSTKSDDRNEILRRGYFPGWRILNFWNLMKSQLVTWLFWINPKFILTGQLKQLKLVSILFRFNSRSLQLVTCLKSLKRKVNPPHDNHNYFFKKKTPPTRVSWKNLTSLTGNKNSDKRD